MQQYLKNYLLLSSICCMFFSSCAISKYQKLTNCTTIVADSIITPIIKSDNIVKFNTTIDVLKNHLTGIVLVKQTDSVTAHIVFVTELGMKMFDFEVKGDSMNAHYVFEPLNKPAIITVLKENFRNILLLNIKGKVLNKCTNKSKQTYLKLSLGNRQNTYLKIEKSVALEHLDKTTFHIVEQETYHGKRLNSKVIYNNMSNEGFAKARAKQYGLIKFYFELNTITE
ncbi:MAG: hypothetical protein IT237_09850 [Bacteroidia bacterium]|nr:hypothetical protein [Bacteroidia bacterium]